MRISLRNFAKSPNATTVVASEPRKGFVLVEIIVAMVLLGVAISSLAALMYSVSQSSQVATGNAFRNGVLMNDVNRLEGVPYDSIPVGTTTITVTTPPYPHTRVITVAETVPNVMKTIKVVITPANSRYKPDTVNFYRTKARTSHVLCTDCTST